MQYASHLAQQLLLNEYSLVDSYFHRSQTSVDCLFVCLLKLEYFFHTQDLLLFRLFWLIWYSSPWFSLLCQNSNSYYFILLPLIYLTIYLLLLSIFFLYFDSISLKFFSATFVSLNMMTTYQTIVLKIVTLFIIALEILILKHFSLFILSFIKNLKYFMKLFSFFLHSFLFNLILNHQEKKHCLGLFDFYVFHYKNSKFYSFNFYHHLYFKLLHYHDDLDYLIYNFNVRQISQKLDYNL